MRNFSRLKKRKASKNKITGDIKNLFEHEEGGYYKPVKLSNFGVVITLNMKLMVTEIKHQLKNMSINLDHT